MVADPPFKYGRAQRGVEDPGSPWDHGDVACTSCWVF